MKNALLIFLTLTLIGMTHPSKADDAKYEFHYMSIDTHMDGVAFEPKALQFKYVKPYSTIVDFEAMLAFGLGQESVDRKIQFATILTQKLRLSSILGAYVKAHVPLEPKVWFFGHLGLARIEYNVSNSISGISPDGSTNDTGLAYGVGLSFNILERGALILQYDQFPDIHADDTKIDTASLSFGYQTTF